MERHAARPRPKSAGQLTGALNGNCAAHEVPIRALRRVTEHADRTRTPLADREAEESTSGARFITPAAGSENDSRSSEPRARFLARSRMRSRTCCELTERTCGLGEAFDDSNW